MTSRLVWGEPGELLPAFEVLLGVCASTSRSGRVRGVPPPVELGVLAFPTIRVWAGRFLRRRFRWSSRAQSRATHDALIDDAFQHLVEAVLQGRFSASESNLPAFIAWCQRVLGNFVISEFRRASRVAPVRGHEAVDAWCGLEMRELACRLTTSLRLRIASSARPRDLARRVALFDEFVLAVLGATQAEADQEPRRYQRVSRGRRLARKAWAELCEVDAVCVEFREVASAFGLEEPERLRSFLGNSKPRPNG